MSSSVRLQPIWNLSYAPAGGKSQVYLLIEVVGTEEEKVDRAPINVGLVLDRSGSMSGSPLQYSKEACQYVVNQMGANDLLSLVVFDSQVKTILEPEKVTYKDLMKQKISQIDTGGTTNLSGGLIQGVQHVLKHEQEGTISRVLLLSDGHANVGITDREALSHLSQEFHASGVGITTLGVGDGFDEETMEAIAEHGGGNFYYIEKADEIPTIFAKELEGLLSVVGQNIHLKVTTSDKTHIRGVHGYPVQQTGQTYSIDLGDIYAGEVKTILLEMNLLPHAPGSHDVIDLEWEFVDVSESIQLCHYQSKVAMTFTNDISLLMQEPNPYVEKQVHLTQMAQSIEKAMKAFDEGDFEIGEQLLKSQAVHLSQMADKLEDHDLAAESKILFSQLENLEYTPQKRKALHQQRYRNNKRKK